MAELVSSSEICKIEWNAKHVFSLPRQESGQFVFRGSCWKLALDKEPTSGSKLIKVFLQDTKRERPFSDFTSRAFIVDKNRTPQFLSENLCKYDRRFGYNNRIWSVKEEDLVDILSMDGDMSFVCILMPRTEEDRGNKPLQTSVNQAAGGSVQTLVLDFRRLLEDSALSDVTLKCGDRTIPAHRAILSTRSEVFAAMLRNDMAKSRSGVIEISDMDPPVLDHLLQFLYSCKLSDMSMDTAPQLYEVADKYVIESLKKDCSAFMKENLTEENAYRILHLADAHNDSDLKDGVMSFIVNAKLFLKDDVWMKFCKDHPILAIEVLNRACKTLVFYVI